MTVAVVVDSTCDLPPEAIARHRLEVVPVHLNIGEQAALDGIDLSREEFYRALPEYKRPPTTAAPSPDRFRQSYQRLAAAGADQILSIHISSSLSATAEMARQAANLFEGADVTVFDGGQVSLGTGFLAVAAARAFEGGASLEAVLELLRDQAERTFVFAALDTLEYLRRSGRLNSLMAGIGGLLRVKPILKMHQGQARSERVRTSHRAFERIHSLVALAAPLDRAALVHTCAPEVARELRARLEGQLPPGPSPMAIVTPVIGAHIGPDVAGVALVARNRPSVELVKEIMG